MQTGISLAMVGLLLYNAFVMMSVTFASILPSAVSKAAENWGVMELFEKGGPLMWPLLVLSVVALMVAFVCLWTTRVNAVLPPRLPSSVESCIRGMNYAGLIGICERDPSIFALTVRSIVVYLQRNPRSNIDEVREIANAEGSRHADVLTRQVNWLSDIGAIAPMIGLLGTVVGMMKTFMEMAQGNFEGVKQMQMALGISEAMITTAGGLVLAIPSMAAYVFFRSRIQKRIADLDVAITHILCVLGVQMDREHRLGNTHRRGTRAEALDDDDDY